jgi:small-conductance mechanosensitive channel
LAPTTGGALDVSATLERRASAAVSSLVNDILGSALGVWMIGIVAGLLAAPVVWSSDRAVKRRLLRSGKTGAAVAAILGGVFGGTSWLVVLAAALFVFGQIVPLSPRPDRVVSAVIMIVLWLQIAVWANRGITRWLGHQLRVKRSGDAPGVASMAVLGFAVRLAAWSLIGLLLLSNLGFDITALVAGLGIGGIAVALAVQNVLGDIFASLSIALDKPFVVGDFIIVDQVLGTVEYVGLKTTRLRSLSGEQIIISNTDLLNSRVRNYKRMTERRVLFSFGVVYQTPPAKLERIPQIARQCIEELDGTRFDRAHFQSFGDSALVFEVVYFVLNADYNAYMDIQQAVNLGIVRAFATEGIVFAYPTRTIYMQSVPDVA